MRTLLLLRHAKSSWKDESLPDHDRPLNKRGKKAAPRMGRLLEEKGLVPDLILSSTAVRARKTAQAAAKACRPRPPVELRESLYLAPPGLLLQQARSHPGPSVERLMLVAHNPGMEDLIEMLAGRRERFPTAALAAFELAIGDWRELELGVQARLVGLWRPKELD